MVLCAANIYSMGEEGIHPKHEIEDGAVIFETDDPEAAKKFGFATRTNAQLAQMAYTPAEQLRQKILVSISNYERTNAAFKTANKMRMRTKRGFRNGGNEPHDPLT